MLSIPYKEPLKPIHQTLNRDEAGASFNVRQVSWSYPRPVTFRVGYQPNPRQHGDYKDHMFYKKLDTYDRVKFSIQSTEPVVFLVKTDVSMTPSFSHEFLQEFNVFNGTIMEYVSEYEAEQELYIVFYFTTVHPIHGYTLHPEYSTNVTFSGELIEYQQFRVKKWVN